MIHQHCTQTSDANLFSCYNFEGPIDKYSTREHHDNSRKLLDSINYAVAAVSMSDFYEGNSVLSTISEVTVRRSADTERGVSLPSCSSMQDWTRRRYVVASGHPPAVRHRRSKSKRAQARPPQGGSLPAGSHAPRPSWCAGCACDRSPV